MNIKKVYVYSIIGLLILVTGIFIVNAVVDLNKVWHSADEISVTINDFDMTFQQAIDEEFLVAGTTSVPDHDYIITPLNPGHSASDILIEVDVYIMSLQDAINYNVLSEGATRDYSTTISGSGHIFSTLHQILITIDAEEMTLQDAIDNEKFCHINYGNTCGSELGDALCINLGITECDGTCIGTSYKAEGTVCGTDMKCDGVGNCISTSIGECTPGDTRTKDCDYLDVTCRNYHDVTDTCDSLGFWTNPPCNSYTNAVKGIFCENRDCYRYECWSDGTCDRQTCTLNGCSCDWDWRCCSDRCSWGECKAKKIICTELYNTGFLDEERYRIDVEYAPSYFSPEALRGYHAWGIPVVEFMRENPTSAIHILPLAKSFIDEVAYRVGEREKGNEIGELFLDEVVPLFERIGVLINEPNVEFLFDENLLQSKTDLTDSVFNNILEKDNKYDELVEDYFTKERVNVVFYEALEKAEGSDMAFARALLENLKKEVEEIEAMVEALEN